MTQTALERLEQMADPLPEQPADPFQEQLPDPFPEQPAEPATAQGTTPAVREISTNLAELTQQLTASDRRIKDLEIELKEEKAKYARIEPVVLEQFAANNMQNQKLKTGETIYIRHDTYVSLTTEEDGSREEAHEALRKNGLEFLVKDNVNSTQLSGWYREKVKQEEEIPEDLLPYLKISDVFRVRVRQ